MQVPGPPTLIPSAIRAVVAPAGPAGRPAPGSPTGHGRGRVRPGRRRNGDRTVALRLEGSGTATDNSRTGLSCNQEVRWNLARTNQCLGCIENPRTGVSLPSCRGGGGGPVDRRPRATAGRAKLWAALVESRYDLGSAARPTHRRPPCQPAEPDTARAAAARARAPHSAAAEAMALGRRDSRLDLGHPAACSARRAGRRRTERCARTCAAPRDGVSAPQAG